MSSTGHLSLLSEYVDQQRSAFHQGESRFGHAGRLSGAPQRPRRYNRHRLQRSPGRQHRQLHQATPRQGSPGSGGRPQPARSELFWPPAPPPGLSHRRKKNPQGNDVGVHKYCPRPRRWLTRPTSLHQLRRDRRPRHGCHRLLHPRRRTADSGEATSRIVFFSFLLCRLFFFFYLLSHSLLFFASAAESGLPFLQTRREAKNAINHERGSSVALQSPVPPHPDLGAGEPVLQRCGAKVSIADWSGDGGHGAGRARWRSCGGEQAGRWLWLVLGQEDACDGRRELDWPAGGV